MRYTLTAITITFVFVISSLFGQSDDQDPVEDQPDFTRPVPRRELIKDLSTLNFQNIEPILNRNQVELPLPLKKKQLKQYQVSSGNSTNPSEDLQPLTSRYTDGRLNLKPGETAVLRNKNVLNQNLTTDKLYLPGRLIKVEEKGDREKPKPSVDAWKLYVEAEQLPLTWKSEAGAYASKIFVGLESKEDAQSSFDGSVNVRFLPRTAGVEIKPKSEVRLTPGGDSKSVLLSSTNPSRKPKVKISSELGEIVSDFDIKPVELIVSPVDRTIPGFGLGTTEINIKCKAGDGTFLREGTFPIRIRKRGEGELENTTLTKKEGNGEVSTTLRSRGSGNVELTAQGLSVTSEPAKISYDPVKLKILPGKKEIQGFGRGQTEIRIKCTSRDGTPLTNGTFQITLEKEGEGKLDRASLKKQPAESEVSTTLESRGGGEITLTAKGHSIKSDPVTISYVGGKLEVSPVESQIPGFGLGTTTINITYESGEESSSGENGVPIMIEKEGGGELTKTSLTKTPGKDILKTELRSSGVGKITLTAKGPSMESKPVTIHFVWPVFILIFSVVGGTVGSGVRLFRQGKEGRKINIAGSLAVGGVAGMLLVFGTALGLGQLNVPTYMATTEAGVLVLALIGGYAGHGVFETLVDRLGLQTADDHSTGSKS